MENASNALLIAGAVLISIMVLGVGVYLVNAFGDSSRQINQQIADTKIAEFNYQFTKYEGIEKIKAHDIVTVCNLAKENNKNRYGYDLVNKTSSPYYITVKVNGSFASLREMASVQNKFETAEEKLYQEFLSKYSVNEASGDPIYFKCTGVSIHEDTKLIREIIFELP